MINNICANCIHAEVCGWCDSVTQDACDFYECDSDWIKADVLQKIRQEIASEAYTKQCFDSDMYDYEDKAIDLDDVYAILDKHLENLKSET